MQFSQINWFAVAIGTAAYMALGFLWYGPILGKAWRAGMARLGKDTSNMKMSVGPMVFPLVGGFASALILDLIIIAFGVSTWWMGLIAGAAVWIGVGATATAYTSVFEGRPGSLWSIFFFYQLMVYAGEGVLFALWK